MKAGEKKMITKEFIREYFIHKYEIDESDQNIVLLKDVNSEQAVITEENDFLYEDDIYFGIWCEKGHLIKASLDTMEDLIKKGCPFCRHKNNYDWQRHIDYAFELDSYGNIIDCLSGYNKYKDMLLDVEMEHSKIMANLYNVNINGVKERCSIIGGLKYRSKKDIYENIYDIDIVNRIWKAFWKAKVECKERNVIPIFKNCKRVYGDYKASEKDLFITECDECHNINISSALTVNAKGLVCRNCGKVLLDKHDWFEYDYERYKDVAWLYPDEYISINPKYGKRLQDLQRYLDKDTLESIKKENIKKLAVKKDDDINKSKNSLLEWCQRDENRDIGDIVIKQFAKKKNRKKLNEIMIDSEEVLWLKGSKGSLFDTTVTNIVKYRKIRPKTPNGTSYPELFIYFALKYFYPDAIHRFKTDEKIEFDIYIPEIKQCIEYNGSVYHKIKYNKAERDLAKQEYCLEHDLKFLIIEDDGEQQLPQIIDNKIVFKDTEVDRDELLYRVCETVKAYLGIEEDLPSIEEIKRSVKLYY